MGVPAFYRWLSDRYPKTIVYATENSEVIEGFDEDGLPITMRRPVNPEEPNPNGIEFDNLYLDMNGIIHPACHPEDKKAPPTERDMFNSVCTYLERVFNIVRPRKLLFMAIDGVAPRAKMNQQRSRRFRAAQEREEIKKARQQLRDQWISEGKNVPDLDEGHGFDSNVITPGTPFMYDLANHLRRFVVGKVNSDPNWRRIKIVFSDANVPGEGEHKIVDYIRRQRTCEGYSKETRHVIHGLDADLIMLSLATHEPYFSILREEVTFQRGNAKCAFCDRTDHKTEECPLSKMEGTVAPMSDGPTRAEAVEAAALQNEKPFQFLHINVLREYLFKEFNQICQNNDFERVIDDFVFLCFFVGNDFLPHLPSLEIREGAIDLLMNLYKELFSSFEGFLTERGDIHFARVQKLMTKLGSKEDEIMIKRRLGEQTTKARMEKTKVDLHTKARSREHLNLIRSMSHDLDAVPANDDGEVFANESEISAEAFRVKNRTAGGHRSLRAGSDEREVRKLNLYDKIREYLYDLEKEKLVLPNLNGYERSMAHQYAEELGLVHTSEGNDPNRYILVTRKGDAAPLDFEDTLKKMQKQESEDNGEIEDEVDLGKEGWQGRYYTAKFGSEADRTYICHKYAEGLAWVFRYYYRGCASWGWFYPFHYAPLALDFVGLEQLSVNFEEGVPFTPFQQLMSVLPPASAHALPQPLAELMYTDELKDFYPTEFEIDLNGKRRAWQAVILLPFIDEARLLPPVKAVEATLLPREKERNARGTSLIFAHMAHPLGGHILASNLLAGGYRGPITPAGELNSIAAAVRSAELNEDPEYQTLQARLVAIGESQIELKIPVCTIAGNAAVSQFAPPLAETQRCVCVQYAFPEPSKLTFTLLRGVMLPPPILTAFDVPVMSKHGHHKHRTERSETTGNAVTPLNGTIPPCVYFFQRGGCNKGDACPYSHDPQSLQPHESMSRGSYPVGAPQSYLAPPPSRSSHSHQYEGKPRHHTENRHYSAAPPNHPPYREHFAPPSMPPHHRHAASYSQPYSRPPSYSNQYPSNAYDPPGGMGGGYPFPPRGVPPSQLRPNSSGYFPADQHGLSESLYYAPRGGGSYSGPYDNQLHSRSHYSSSSSSYRDRNDSSRPYPHPSDSNQPRSRSRSRSPVRKDPPLN